MEEIPNIVRGALANDSCPICTGRVTSSPIRRLTQSVYSVVGTCAAGCTDGTPSKSPYQWELIASVGGQNVYVTRNTGQYMGEGSI